MADTWNVRIVRGERFDESFQLREDSVSGSVIALTGWAFAGKIKKEWDSTSVIATISFTVADDPATSTTDGLVTAELNESITVALESRTYVWDVFATPPGGGPACLFQGTFEVGGSATP